jgi:hypothetical protein
MYCGGGGWVVGNINRVFGGRLSLNYCAMHWISWPILY